MKSIASTAAATIAAACLAGCQTTTSAPAPVQATPVMAEVDLTGNWRLLELNGIQVKSGASVVGFQADGRFVATVYCNEARGLYVVRGRSLSFDGWDATERGCNGDTAQAAAIGSALRGDNYMFSVDVSGDLLLDGPARLRLRRF